MLEIPSFLGIFLIGLLGGGHCLGMCGGFVSAVSLQIPPNRHFGLFLLCNLGRITSYSIAGMIVGGLGSAGLLLMFLPIQKLLYLLANVLLILLGLSLAQVWQGVRKIENFGTFIWRFLQPLLRYFLPPKTPVQAFFLGAIWGWLPCGLVYSVLLTALASMSLVQGFLIMLVFGLGTLPALLLMGKVNRALFANRQLQKWGGWLVVLMGLWGVGKVVV